MMGTPLGPGVSGERRQQAIEFCAHWPPIVQAQRDGTAPDEARYLGCIRALAGDR